jgi:hypothetical protein
MSTPIACPRCTSETKVKNHAGDHYCVDCQEWFTPEYLAACDRCSCLQAVMYSSNFIVIKPQRGTGDAELIEILFEKEDRRYYWPQGWTIHNITKYAHLKCVQSATLAFLQQHSFIEMI